MKNKLIILMFVFVAFSCRKNKENNSFSFAFITDAHLTKNQRTWDLFNNTLNQLNELSLDFVVTGGDNVELDKNIDTTVARLNKFKKLVDNSPIKIYPCIGNGEHYKSASNNGSDSLYETYVHKANYSFDIKNWHFAIINTCNARSKIMTFDTTDAEWLKYDLHSVGSHRPVALVMHAPYFNIHNAVVRGKEKVERCVNHELLTKLIKKYNVKLILQGHYHWYEHVYCEGIDIFTGGAFCGAWWKGPRNKTENGYLKFNVQGEQISYEYKELKKYF